MIFNETLDQEFLETWNLPNNYVELLDYLLATSGIGDLICPDTFDLNTIVGK